MGAERVARLQHEVRARAQAAAHEVVVNAAEGEQRRDAHLAGGRAVRDDHDVRPGAHVLLDLLRQGVQGVGECVLPAGREVGRARARDLEARPVDRADAPEVRLRDDWTAQSHEPAAVATVFEQVAVVAKVERRARNHALAQGVDRRVGNLREELVEVVEERAVARGEARERRVHAHRGQRHRALLGHRSHDLVHVIVVPAKASHALGERDAQVALEGQVRLAGNRQARKVHRLLVEPVAVGLLARQAVAYLVVPDDPALHGVHLEHLAGSEAARAQDVRGVDVDGAHLGGQNQPVVARHVVARGTQTVAVERGAQHATVREHDRRRPVPRLHQH